MTYGWMLLVVAIVGGLIITLASNQSIDQISGFEGQQIVVENFGVNSQEQLSLQVLNTRRGTAEISNVTVEGNNDVRFNDSDFAGSDPEILELGSQESAEVLVTGFNRTESGESFEVNIYFDRSGLTNLVSKGRISGTLRMVDE